MSPGQLSPRQLVRRFLPPAVFVLLIGWHQGWGACGGPPASGPAVQEAPHTLIQGEAFGAGFSLKVSGARTPSEEQALNDVVGAILSEVDLQVSTWRPDSALARFNAAADTAPRPFPAAPLGLIGESLALGAASQGAFDVTVRPLVRLWGFGSGAATVEPLPAQLDDARAFVGNHLLVVDLDGGTLQKRDPRVEVDLSAIAPGWAADLVAAKLEEMGLHDWLIDVGGELRGKGRGPDGAPWRVAIEQPDAVARQGYAFVELSSGALATSGDYRAYREVDGQRVSHTIDPRTGHTVRHRLASVSVLHPRAALADGWATALNVLGPNDGLRLAEELGLAAFFIVRNPDGSFTPAATRAWVAAQGPAPGYGATGAPSGGAAGGASP
ncbi:MAG: FAD:protein FMN transferase [Deltaproteobacteria bacterium]|nr:FAD:protein FMN transferase [Deltaproteobacteria bacterium]